MDDKPKINNSVIDLLVVDDSSASCSMLKLLLKQIHYVRNITSFYRGEEALEWLKDNLQVMILLDFDMPMSGLDFIQQAHALESTLPVIFISGCQEDKCVAAALELGADGYIIKPVSLSRLDAEISLVFRRKFFEAQSIQQDLKKLRSLQQLADWDGIIAMIQGRGKEAQGNIKMMLALAEALEKQKKLSQSQEVLERAVTMTNSFFAPALERLAKVTFAQGKSEEALALMKKTIEITHDSLASPRLLDYARMLGLAGKAEEAATVAVKAVKLNPTYLDQSKELMTSMGLNWELTR